MLPLLISCAGAGVVDFTPAVPDDPKDYTPNAPDNPFGDLTDTALETDAPIDTDVPIDTNNPTPVVHDCSSLPPAPTTWTELNHISPSEEFAFDAYGNLVNLADGLNTLLLTPYTGPAQIVTTYQADDLAGITILPNGDVVQADEARGILVQFGMDGSRVDLLTNIYSPNSVAVGADGHVYTTAFDQIWEVDPATGDSYMIYELDGLDLDGLAFDPTFNTLYFNHDSGGTVGAFDLVGTGVVTNERIVAQINSGGELDGAAMDECGNLYVVVTNGRIYRVFPDGTQELFVTISGSWNTTSLHFGSGIGGWEQDHLYVMSRAGSVFELDVAIRGRSEPHLTTVP
jgi:hypothetical protein